MSLPKILALFTFLLFALIALAGWWKQGRNGEVAMTSPVEVILEHERKVVDIPAQPRPKGFQPAILDRVNELFNTTGPHLPIVETITYKSHVPWLKGRQAWLSDYASHYHTSRHFIARSLNGKADYEKQDIAEGARFNVFRSDLPLQFHLVVDLSSCHLWLYYQNLESGDRELLKRYTVGLGRSDSTSTSGTLTPLGSYSLGEKVAILTPQSTGMYRGEKTQLIRIFGTRWIPFDKAVGESSHAPKGYGIHGLPWQEDGRGVLVEDRTSLGQYASDGCIRLASDDMEELFAIVITKPTVVEIVREFHEARFPALEKED